MAITRVNSSTIKGSGTSATQGSIALGLTTQKNDLIIVSFMSNGRTSNNESVTDNLANTYVSISESQGGNASSKWLQAWYFQDTVGGITTVKPTPYSGATIWNVTIDVFRGASNVQSVAATKSSNTSSTTATGTQLLTAPAAGCLVLGFIGDSGTTYTNRTTTYAWVLGSADNSNANAGGSAIEYILSAGGTTKYAADWTLGAANTSATITATFNAAVANTLTATAGSYALTGGTVNLNRSIDFIASNGAYNVTGDAATLTKAVKITGASGVFTLNGIAANLPASRRVIASQGSISVNGQNALLTYTPITPIIPVIPTDKPKLTGTPGGSSVSQFLVPFPLKDMFPRYTQEFIENEQKKYRRKREEELILKGIL